MTMKNIVLGLLCCSIVTTGFFLTACKPSENGTGVIIHEDGTTSLMEGPGDTSRLASYQDVGFSILAMKPSEGSTDQGSGDSSGGSDNASGVSGSDSSGQMTGSKGTELAFEVLPNAWNGAAFDRPAYQQVFREKYGVENQTPQTVTDGSVIRLDFGEYQPKDITVKQDFNRYTAVRQEPAESAEAFQSAASVQLAETDGSPSDVSEGTKEVLEIPLSNNSFTVTYDGNSETVYDIQCDWSNGNSVEYALIMRAGS